MYLRCHKRLKDGKEHRYWSVVESVHTPGIHQQDILSDERCHPMRAALLTDRGRIFSQRLE